MSFQSERLGGHMAAAVTGLDLNRLPDHTTRAALVGLLHDNLVLCIRGQALAPPAFRDAMAQFGAPMLRKQLARTAECAEVNIISSEDRDELGDGRKIVNGANWRTDDSFMREPCSFTMLYGVVVPSRGGDTQFTNLSQAYADLPAETKARSPARRADRPFHRGQVPVPPCLASGRYRDLGQPLHHAQGQRRLSRRRTPPEHRMIVAGTAPV